MELKTTIVTLGILLAYLGTSESSTRNKLEKVFFLVMDQSNPYHAIRSQQFIEHLNLEAQKLGGGDISISLQTQRFPNDGGWTLFPILDHILKAMTTEEWLFVCEEETRIDLKALLEVLDQYSVEENQFLGKGLFDREPSVPHHYSMPDKNSPPFLYPHLGAGFILSKALLKSMSQHLQSKPLKLDFNIDALYEIAKFMSADLPGQSVKLTNIKNFCIGSSAKKCITWQSSSFPSCGEPVAVDDIFIAVKTHGGNHEKRIPIIKKTWVKDARNIEFYSDVVDEEIPTIDLGVHNVEHGHCGKTYAILSRALKQSHIKDKKWFVLVDDDTLLSIPRLQKLLSCYDHDDNIALGERYGYGASSNRGYNYITLGGGMVLSFPSLHELITNSGFKCPSNDSPDDMILGMALQKLGISIVHSPLFHQARPDDYCRELIGSQKSVSFHRFWNSDPLEDYQKYLHVSNKHDEL